MTKIRVHRKYLSRHALVELRSEDDLQNELSVKEPLSACWKSDRVRRINAAVHIPRVWPALRKDVERSSGTDIQLHELSKLSCLLVRALDKGTLQCRYKYTMVRHGHRHGHIETRNLCYLMQNLSLLFLWSEKLREGKHLQICSPGGLAIFFITAFHSLIRWVTADRSPPHSPLFLRLPALLVDLDCASYAFLSFCLWLKCYILTLAMFSLLLQMDVEFNWTFFQIFRNIRLLLWALQQPA